MATNSIMNMLVAGYMRESQYLLKDNTINVIPASVVDICYKFYYVMNKLLLMYKKSESNTIKLWNCNSPINHCPQISYKKFLNAQYIPYGSCYIPNISSYLSCKYMPNNIDIKNNQYDGIFHFIELIDKDADPNVWSSDDDTDYISCLTLFDQKTLNTINKPNIYSITYPSNDHYISTVKQSLFCDEKHGIICDGFSLFSSLHLKQLKFEDIGHLYDYNKFNLTFGIIPGSEHTLYSKRSNCFLQLCYSNNIESIFAISCYYDYTSRMMMPKYQKKTKPRKCAIFDLNKNTWKMVKRYESSEKICNGFLCGTCYSNYNDNVYMVTNKNGETARLDVHKNEWMYLNKLDALQNMDHYRPIIWMDNVHNYAPILNCAVNNGSMVRIYKLDMRQKHKWTEFKVFNGNYDELLFQ